MLFFKLVKNSFEEGGSREMEKKRRKREKRGGNEGDSKKGDKK